MDYPKLNVSNQREESISTQRVNLDVTVTSKESKKKNNAKLFFSLCGALPQQDVLQPHNSGTP